MNATKIKYRRYTIIVLANAHIHETRVICKTKRIRMDVRDSVRGILKVLIGGWYDLERMDRSIRKTAACSGRPFTVISPYVKDDFNWNPR